jgi:hypothetical protein
MINVDVNELDNSLKENRIKISWCKNFDVLLTPKDSRNLNYLTFERDKESYLCKLKNPEMVFQQPKPPEDLQLVFRDWYYKNRICVSLVVGKIRAGYSKTCFLPL